MTEYWARFSDDGRGQPLEDHLLGVARRAKKFAEAFGAGDWAYLAGLWHDLGKYRAEFQKRLQGANIQAEHSGLGAALAEEKDKKNGLLLAFAIAGHHAGLSNRTAGESGQPTPLTDRLRNNKPLLAALRSVIPSEIDGAVLPEFPGCLQSKPGMGNKTGYFLARKGEMWIRFLFSALVDADRLDSECFKSSERAILRSRQATIDELRQRLDSFIGAKMAALTEEKRARPVNVARAEVLAACRAAAGKKPGLFTLTVPTGGGKTLSAMSLALNHAVKYDLRRVIVVIPYTSIIEQNAKEYRKALGAGNVIEHHHNLDPEKTRKTHGEETADRHELAAENWDAPVIVTTTVQFFESLFSNRPARCRKLHNVARSVIILDEVQTLPPEFLLAIMEALNTLTDHYGCSLILTTATPPALTAREGFDGLESPRQVMENPEELARRLKRVEYKWPDLAAPPTTFESLAELVAIESRVLAVVHRRQDARELAELVKKMVDDDSVYHLSALMCPAHRSEVVKAVKADLYEGRRCRLISTQLIEAGVDVDFPVVFRALAGLDSVVQAAGRCNREGRPEKGRVIVFRAPTKPPTGTPQRGLATMETMLNAADGTLEPGDPALCEEYFRRFYQVSQLDAKGIQTARQEYRFADAGRNFRLIEDEFTQPVVVLHGDASERLEKIRKLGPDRDRLRALQPFLVVLYPRDFERLRAAGAVEEVVEGLWALTDVFKNLYDPTFGLVLGDEIRPDVEMLVK